MASLKDFLDLIRIKQLIFKNAIIGAPLLFSIGKFPLNQLGENLFFIFLGFLSLCFISITSYIVNDIIDSEKDKNHPEKNKRPIASGRIQKKGAFLIAILSLIISLNLAIILSVLSSWIFFFFVLALFLTTQSYNVYFRKIAYLDIIIISIGFVIRANSGAFIIEGGEISYWLILSTFFLSLFLVSSKRLAESKLEKIGGYRKTYEKVSKEILMIVVYLSMTSVIIFFSIYSILFGKPLLLLSLPISIYLVLLYFDCMDKNPEKIRNPEKFIFTKKILVLLSIWFILITIALIFSIVA